MKVVVLAGGLSTERDVSIISGTKVCEALRARGHKAILLDVFLGYPKEYDIHTIFDKKDSLIPGEAGIQAEDPDIEKIKKPVSYTHLDVYKRQVLAKAARPMV